LQKAKEEELAHSNRIEKRVENLSQIENITSSKAPEFISWSKTRLDRIIVDYLLREGMTNTAKRVAEDSGIEVIIKRDSFFCSYSEYIGYGGYSTICSIRKD
jgi:macrophage erythroblast attacher